MKLKKILLPLAFFALSLSLVPQTANAQWSLGASYEIRDAEPKNGFGVRVEREILSKLPVINLGIRAHFSYFNENISYENQTYSTDITNYDYGVAAVGGVSVGPIDPYVGLGLGASTLDVTRENLGNVQKPQESNDNAIYWNGFVGAKVSIIPALKPFVEYRLEDVSNYEDELNDIDQSNGRLMFGVSLSF
ncbi:outer membrane protein [Fodinibius halophilus]|uniref:Outer membrane beta-barrel protein n=1 Tax=Fodinibius halophilus TaxID=1736908 RepID=A0A6M1T5Q8_9BACT|nr:outer membrane beta-barrel protein [Fodinibius halophilus]NGP89437.1 outer membrane beta-barrel protein [Fodinibius halophilus]